MSSLAGYRPAGAWSAAVRPRRSFSRWYFLAAVGTLVGILAFAGLETRSAMGAEPAERGRSPIPGVVAVDVRGPGELVATYEGPGSPSVSDLGLYVSDPAGRFVPVGIDVMADIRDEMALTGNTEPSPRSVGTIRVSSSGVYQIRTVNRMDPRAQLVISDPPASNLGSTLTSALLIAFALFLGATGLAGVMSARSRGIC